MDSRAIPHNQLPHTSRLFQDYLYDFPRVSEFYGYAPFALDSFRRAAESLRYSSAQRQAMVDVLKEQNQALAASPATLRNVERLAQPGCCAVLTGQQVGLFAGPAFGLYKALTAVRLAHFLTGQGLEAVPVFWLATEDHDFAEVNHCFIQDREGNPQRLVYNHTPPAPNAPVGALELSEEILGLLESLRQLLPDSEEAASIIAMVRQSYAPGIRLGAAFGRMMARLFGESGVIMLDPLDARIHRLSAPVFQTAIGEARSIAADLLERNRQLLERGYHAQVHVAENSSLLFLYEEGQRIALRLEGAGFRSASGSSLSAEDLLRIAQESPERLSPNVLLRPVMQDALLPTIAYVGGPSELAYLAQAAPVYQRSLGRLPVFYPRASFSVLDGATHRLLNKYEVSLADICAGKQGLRQKMALRYLPPDLTSLFERASSGMRQSLEDIRSSLARLDPTLVDAAQNSAQKMQYQLSSLERKAAAAVQLRGDLIERDAARLENNLCPERVLQERFYGGVSLLARYGSRLLLELDEQISLNSPDHQMVVSEPRQ